MPGPVRPTNGMFADAITQRAMAQIATAAGYKSAETEAIEAMTTTTKVFILEIGKIARAFAELSGRNQVNSFDVAAAIADYGQPIDQLNGFVQNSDPLPFFNTNLPFLVVSRPIIMPQNGDPRISDDIPPRANHIPEYLPPFPDRFTFQSSKDVPSEVSDVEGLRKRKFEQSRAVEAGLVEIQSARENVKQGLTGNTSFGAVQEHNKVDENSIIVTSLASNSLVLNNQSHQPKHQITKQPYSAVEIVADVPNDSTDSSSFKNVSVDADTDIEI